MPLGRYKNVVRNGLSQPEARGGEQGSTFQGTGSSLNLNHADKVLGAPNEEQVNAPLPRLSFRAQFGKAASSVEPFQTLGNSRGLERLTDFLRDNSGEVSYCQLRIAI
jgi:hypothetical protein